MLVEGKAEIYAAKGELSFRATTIERIGLGDHLAAIERLKRALAAEGLFAAERKRPLPRFPRAVGIVTGADAAARGDVVTAIQDALPGRARRRRRDARAGRRARAPDRRGARARSRPTRTSTSSSSPAAAAASRICCRSATRPSCARSPRCPVPVVSAVGHEQDTPLCDLAADVRASTPTAAARLVVPDLGELQAGLARLRERLDGSRPPRARPRPRAPRPQPRAPPGGTAAPARAAAGRARPCRRPAPGALTAGDARPRLRDRARRAASRSATPPTRAPASALEIELARGGLDARRSTEVRP